MARGWFRTRSVSIECTGRTIKMRRLNALVMQPWLLLWDRVGTLFRDAQENGNAAVIIDDDDLTDMAEYLAMAIESIDGQRIKKGTLTGEDVLAEMAADEIANSWLQYYGKCRMTDVEKKA